MARPPKRRRGGAHAGDGPDWERLRFIAMIAMKAVAIIAEPWLDKWFGNGGGRLL
ncbi:MAG TPA: hypothetical protein VGG75_14750 [Trebonia sp.]|jgi:hypothetical protein